MKNILVTLDFDKNRNLLLEKALEMGIAFDSKVWFLHVASPLVQFEKYTQTESAQKIIVNRADELKEEHDIMQEAAQQLIDKGVKAEGLLIAGMTTELIMEKATELNVNLIITGHHTHGFFYNALMGSVSAEIIKQAKIPVMVVPLD